MARWRHENRRANIRCNVSEVDSILICLLENLGAPLPPYSLLIFCHTSCDVKRGFVMKDLTIVSYGQDKEKAKVFTQPGNWLISNDQAKSPALGQCCLITTRDPPPLHTTRQWHVYALHPVMHMNMCNLLTDLNATWCNYTGDGGE